MKIDIDFIKRVILSLLWISRNYLRFIYVLNKQFHVKNIKIQDLRNWHGHACYFTANYNKDKVFIKTLKSEFEILQNEQTAINLISHNSDVDYVPKLYLHGQIGGDDFILLEYISGNTLDYHLRNCLNEFNTQDRIEIASQLIGIVEELHDMKVIHRDLRPDNIFITFNNAVKLILIDFSFVIDSDNWNKSPRFHDIQNTKRSMDIRKALGQEYKPEELQWDDAFAIHKILYENNHLFNISNELLKSVKDKIGLEVFTIEDS